MFQTKASTVLSSRQVFQFILLVVVFLFLGISVVADAPTSSTHLANVWIKRTPLPDAPVSPRLGYE